MEPRASPGEARSPPQVFSTPPTSVSRKRLRSPNESPMSPTDTPVPVRRRAMSLVPSPLGGLAREEDEVVDALSQGAGVDVEMDSPGGRSSPTGASSTSGSPARRSPSPSPLLRNLLPVFAHAAMLLSNIGDTLRRHRADIGKLSTLERGQCWATIGGSLDSLNSAVHTLSGDYGHVSSVMGGLTDNLAELERRFGCAPALAPDDAPGPRAPSTPPRQMRSPSPGDALLDRSSRPTLIDRIQPGRRSASLPPAAEDPLSDHAHEGPALRDDWTDWTSTGFDTADEDMRSDSAASRAPSRGPSRPPGRLPLERRLLPPPPTDSRPASRADSVAPSNASRPTTRGRSPAPARRHRELPAHWKTTLFVVFSANRPAHEDRLPNGVIHANLATAFERSHDLRHVQVTSMMWTGQGNITVILNTPPNPDITSFVCARIAALYPNIPRSAIEVRPYRVRSCLGFYRVPCIDASFNEISPRAAAKPIFDCRGLWGEVAARPTTLFRWGTSREGDTARELVVELADDEDHTTGDLLLKERVIFDCGPLRPHIMKDRRLVAQCSLCFRWAHSGRHCEAAGEVCVRCGGNHSVAAHNRLAPCCSSRPDRNSTPCPHPPSCVNCKGAHYATDRSCEYFKHRSDHSWYADKIVGAARIHATLEERIATPNPTPATSTPATEAGRTNAGNKARARARGGRRKGAGGSGRGRA